MRLRSQRIFGFAVVAITLVFLFADIWFLASQLKLVVVWASEAFPLIFKHSNGDSVPLEGLSNLDYHCLIRPGIWIVVSLVGIGIVGWVYTLGWRLMKSSAREVLSNDSRPPVTFLRSFRSDRKQIDAYLNDVVSRYGPLVCVGRPSDPVSPLGASRQYFDSDKWQEPVTELLRDSSLVILLPGPITRQGEDSPSGLHWEFEQCKNISDPRRVIVLVERKLRDYEEVRRVARKNLGITLPKIEHGIFAMSVGDIAGIVRFDEKWKGRFVPMRISGFTVLGMGNKNRPLDRIIGGVLRDLGIRPQRPSLGSILSDSGVRELAPFEVTAVAAMLAYTLWAII
jgi:hypothetical protein